MIKNNFSKAAVAAILAGVVLLSGSQLAAVKADTPDSGLTGFSLPAVTGAYCINACPGTDATQLNFNWITQAKGAAQIKYAPASAMNGSTFPSSATVVNANQYKVTATQEIDQDTTDLGSDLGGVAAPSDFNDGVYNGKKPQGLFTGEYQNAATLTGLTPATKYSYSVSDGNGNWSPVYTMSTVNASSIAFAAFGDPQIGAFDDGKGTAKSDSTGGHKSFSDDATGWQNMLSLVTQNSKLDFLFSLGDQVNDYSNLISDTATTDGGQWNEYNSFMNKYIQSYPLAAFSGNHDHQMGEYYGYHYNQPNRGTLGATQYGNDGDYWFTAGPVLFMVLNANNYGTADHDSFMAKAVSSNPNVKWKVAVWHQSAYSESKSHAANNSVDDPVLTIRKTWPAMMEKHGVDVVLQGHDHYYTRTAQLLGGNVIDPSTGATETLQLDSSKTAGSTTTNANATFAAKNYPSAVTNPKGIVYFTLDSGSGSKFYDYGATTDHTFSVVGWQGYVPTYSYINFSDSQFTINTYSTTDYKLADQKLIDSYTINKTASSSSSSSAAASSSQTVSSSSSQSSSSGVSSSTDSSSAADSTTLADNGASSTADQSSSAASSQQTSNPFTGANGLFNIGGMLLLLSAVSGVSVVILRKKRA